MDVELHQQVLAAATVLAGLLVIVVARSALVPHITNGQIDQEVVVRLSQLQETLTALYILHQPGCVAPDAVRGRHIYAGIELPTGPRVVLWRVARTVEVDVIDAAGEHQIEVGLHLRQRSTEVLRQPGECLTTRQWFPRHMGCRRGILEHRVVRVVLAGLAWILTESFDTEFR